MGYQVLIVRIGVAEVVQKPTKIASGDDLERGGGIGNMAVVAHDLRWGGRGIHTRHW